MKKKFIAVYALIGVLALGSTTLTSCVDDNESASVTAIRDAKAAQLNALANYNNAQAEAKKIIAEAEAALRNADAEAKRIQNEQDSLKLEIAKATISTDIEAALAKAEADLAAQKAAAAYAQAELEKVVGAVDLATQEKINNLLTVANAIMYGGNYKYYGLSIYGTDYPDGQYPDNTNVTAQLYTGSIAASESLYGDEETDGLKSQLVDKKANRLTAEYELKDIQRNMAEYVRGEQEKLAKNQALLAEYQKYSNTDRDAAKKAADEADAKVEGLQEAEDQATALYCEEAAKIDQANTNLKATEVETFFAKNSKYGVKGTDCVITREAPKGEEIVVTYDDGTSTVVTPNYTSYYTYIKNENSVTGDVTYTPQQKTVKKQIIVDEEALADLVTEKARDLDVANENLKTAQEAHTNGLKDEASVNVTIKEGEYKGQTWSGTYKQLKDEVAKATKAWNEDKADIDLRETMEKFEAFEKQHIADLDEGLKKAEKGVTDAEEKKAEIDALNTMLTGEAFKTYTSVYEALVKAVDASMEKNIEKMKAEHNTDVQETLAATLGNIAAGYTDWTAEIAKVQKEIDSNEKNIATIGYNKLDDDGNTTDDSSKYSEAEKQAYIEALDAEIAELETKIALRESQYDTIMQQVEELINSDDTTTPAPETPAEGEETPAA